MSGDSPTGAVSDPVPSPADLDRWRDEAERGFHDHDVLRKRLIAAVALAVSLSEHADTLQAERDEMRVKLTAVEALLPRTDEEFPIFPSQVRQALGATSDEYLLLRWADIKVGRERVSAAEAALAQAVTDMTALCGEMDFWDARWAIEHCIDIVRVLQGRLDTNQETNHD